MTQASRPQADNVASGYIDAGPYSADEWAERIALSVVGDPSTATERAQLRGVIPTVLDKLVVTNPAGVTIRVSTGAAWVNGRMLASDAVAPSPTDFTPSTPGANRIDRVVVVENNTNVAYNTNLEFPTDLTDYDGLASVPAYSARLAILTGVAGGAMRALVQNANYWMIELARYTISAVPAISAYTDQREFSQIEHIVGVHSDDDDTIKDALIIGTQVDDAAAGAAGLGVGIHTRLEDAGGTLQDAGSVASVWHTAAAGAEVSQWRLYTQWVTFEVLSAVITAPVTTSADGNARGTGSVDLQGHRTAAAQVASGGRSVIGGGQQNTASGTNSTVSGGIGSTASSTAATVAGGSVNTASGLHTTVSGGQINVASGAEAVVAGGQENTAGAGNYTTVGGGYLNVASADMATVPGGSRVVANKYGQWAYASGRISGDGDAQGSLQIVRLARATHVSGTWYALYPDGGAGPQRLTIAASTAWTIHCQVVGITQNAAQQWSYELIGLIERDNANNTTLAAQTQRVIFESDANYAAWLAADDANEALEVQVRRAGGVDYSVRWVATIRTAEVTFP